MPFELQIPRSIYQTLITQAQAELPNECCGLLAGHPDGRVVAHYPLVNALANPRRFESDPRSLLAAEKHRRSAGLEFLAVYHSHPTSPPIPSGVDTDPNVNYWCGVEIVSLIISLLPPEPTMRAWWIVPHGYREAAWRVTDPSQ